MKKRIFAAGVMGALVGAVFAAVCIWIARAKHERAWNEAHAGAGTRVEIPVLQAYE